MFITARGLCVYYCRTYAGYYVLVYILQNTAFQVCMFKTVGEVRRTFLGIFHTIVNKTTYRCKFVNRFVNDSMENETKKIGLANLW